MIIIVFHNGNIVFYSMIDSTQSKFVCRGSIELGEQLHSITLDNHMLICTFDSTVSIDFVFINLEQFKKTEEVLNNNQILKILVKFDQPLEPKTIKQIILPYRIGTVEGSRYIKFPLFIALTSESLYVIHLCGMKKISYARIEGQFDLASMHINNLELVYTAHGGVIRLYMWTCLNSKDDNHILHQWQLYVTIDVSSSSIRSIFSAPAYALMFFCLLQNGAIHLYNAKDARQSLKTTPPFPRTNRSIQTIKLLNGEAITLDRSQRELTSWSYQHSTSIESTRTYENNIIVDNFAMICSNTDPKVVFILILTSNHCAEIYLTKSLDKNCLFHLELNSSSRVHSTTNGSFLILTQTGSIHHIVEESKFVEKTRSQLDIQCSMMLSSILRINSREYLVIFDDIGKSMAIWSNEQIIYVNLNFPHIVLPFSSHLLSLIGESSQDSVSFHFNNRNLILCQIKLEESNKKAYLNMTSFDKVDKFCLKKHYLAQFSNNEHQLSWYDINLSKYHPLIQMSNECLQLCMNESSNYIFALIQPCILHMYRTIDNQQLAKLTLYDFASFLVADRDFIVLSMNDRRLLTLMIADPKDRKLIEKLQALPSRNSNQSTNSESTDLVQRLQKRCDGQSSEEDSDLSDDDGNTNFRQNSNIHWKIKMAAPISSFQLVRRFPARCSSLKMSSNKKLAFEIIPQLCDESCDIDVTEFINDSDDDREANEQATHVVCPTHSSDQLNDEMESQSVVNPTVEDDSTIFVKAR
ncbi:unnamed protein product [Adineta ricciae]|uniref:Uncharacterized protein n=1 Tax=Adineta ricciae TaxID=249248 RepID=A0A815MUM0_ADIRI|nr:unnamed protein product [Adineta ricciae]CAF1423127.1 unnamed protein product [Adineta ricciae]